MEAVRASDIDEWSQICSSSFVPLRVVVGDSAFQGSIVHVGLGEIGVSHVTCTRSRVYRHAHQIAAEPRDDVLLSIHLTGTGEVDQAGRCVRLAGGAAAMYEADRPYDLRLGPAISQLVLQVPRRRLRLRDAAIRDGAARLIDADSTGLVVLRHFLSGVVDAGCAPGLEDHLGETAVDLLSSILRPYAAGHEVQPPLGGEALLYAARVFMQRHFGDHDLNIDTIARRHAVSRRYLEILFARSGDRPGAYLRRVRLESATRLLRDSSMSISRVAHDSGFRDVTTFGRAFKREFGLTPRE